MFRTFFFISSIYFWAPRGFESAVILLCPLHAEETGARADFDSRHTAACKQFKHTEQRDI